MSFFEKQWKKQQTPEYDKPDFISYLMYAFIAGFLFLIWGLPIIEYIQKYDRISIIFEL